jgi:subtilisin family serine protease
MNHLDLIKLKALMELTDGRSEIVIGLIDGPVAPHSDLVSENIREIPGRVAGTCTYVNSAACAHGTFIAGMLCAKRTSVAPAICPHCTLLVRPIFLETTTGNEMLPGATSGELAAAIINVVQAGARILNLSVAHTHHSKEDSKLEEALDYAMKHDVIVVAAVGNQGVVGSTPITRHPWVIPVVACDLQGRPMSSSNLGGSIARRGLMAPGKEVTSLGVDGKTLTFGGTSAAAPFVTGAIALLWSEFPTATGAEVKFVATQAYTARRTTIVPPLLDAWAAHQMMTTYGRK